MTLNLLYLYNECAGQPWSMYDNDAETNEDFESALKTSINKAISVLWNMHPWQFKKQKTTIKTKKSRALYSMPNGSLYKKTVNGATKYGIKCDGKFLDYINDFELLESKTGTPDSFYIDGENICLYPTPDNEYVLEVQYLPLAYGLNADGEAIYELKEDDDYINIPGKYEVVFKNCLISLAMIYAIADESDENHSGYMKQYEDALVILEDYCYNGTFDRKIVW